MTMRGGFAGSMRLAPSSQIPIGIHTTSSSSRKRTSRGLRRPSTRSPCCMRQQPTARCLLVCLPCRTSRQTLSTSGTTRGTPRMSSGFGAARTRACQMTSGPSVEPTPGCLRTQAEPRPSSRPSHLRALRVHRRSVRRLWLSGQRHGRCYSHESPIHEESKFVVFSSRPSHLRALRVHRRSVRRLWLSGQRPGRCYSHESPIHEESKFVVFFSSRPSHLRALRVHRRSVRRLWLAGQRHGRCYSHESPIHEESKFVVFSSRPSHLRALRVHRRSVRRLWLSGQRHGRCYSHESPIHEESKFVVFSSRPSHLRALRVHRRSVRRLWLAGQPSSQNFATKPADGVELWPC